MQHFAGPRPVQRLVAAEVFHVWAKRRLSSSIAAAPWSTSTQGPSTPSSVASVLPSALSPATSIPTKALEEPSMVTPGFGPEATPPSVLSTALAGGTSEASSVDGTVPPPATLPLPMAMGPMAADEGKPQDGTLTASVGIVNGTASGVPPLAVTSSGGGSGTQEAVQVVKPGSTAGSAPATTPGLIQHVATGVDAEGINGLGASGLGPSAIDVNGARSASELAVMATSGIEAGGTADAAVAGTMSVNAAGATALWARAAVSSYASTELRDDSLVTIAGPPSMSGAPRLEVRMTVGELREARMQRTSVFKHLVNTMLKDPVIQAGELETITHQAMMLTSQAALAGQDRSVTGASLSSAADPVATVSNGEARTLPVGDYMGSVAQSCPNGTAPEVGGISVSSPPTPSPPASALGLSMATAGGTRKRGSGEWVDASDMTTPTPAVRLDPLFEARGNSVKREREGPDAGYQEGGGKRLSAMGAVADAADAGKKAESAVDEGTARGAEAEAEAEAGLAVGEEAKISGDVEVEGQGNGEEKASRPALTPEAAAASRSRRQLWMQEISANERRYERRKEEARREFEARQQQLLMWMVDEEAGRHDELDGDAGPPPDETLVSVGCTGVDPVNVECSGV